MNKRIIAVGILKDDQDRYLICKMPDSRGVYPGQWGLIGGGIEPDETMTQGLKREVREEANLEIKEIEPWYFHDVTKNKLFPDGNQQETYLVFLMFTATVIDPIKIKLNEEWSDFAWVKLNQISTYELNEATQLAFSKLINHNGQTTDLHQLWLDNPQGLIPTNTLCPHCARYNARNVVGHALVVKDNQVLMIKRANQPMSGWWAIPAGYLDWHETVEENVIRELKEETGLDGKIKSFFRTYSQPNRDVDRRENVALVYLVEATGETSPQIETSEVKWFPLNKLPENIAFDHRQMITDYIQSMK